MKAGSALAALNTDGLAGEPPAFITSRYFGCQTAKKRSGPFGFPQEAGPLLASLY